MKQSRAKSNASRPALPMRGKKTWREKLQDDKDLPKVVPMPRRNDPEQAHDATMLVPAPREVDALMRRVPRGRVTTVDDLRTLLAARHGATMTCPITTGIFAWMAAQASNEASAAGESRITPYWRTLKAKGEINPRYPGGITALAARLEAEGHAVFQKGKRFYVRDFERVLADLSAFAKEGT